MLDACSSKCGVAPVSGGSSAVEMCTQKKLEDGEGSRKHRATIALNVIPVQQAIEDSTNATAHLLAIVNRYAVPLEVSR